MGSLTSHCLPGFTSDLKITLYWKPNAVILSSGQLWYIPIPLVTNVVLRLKVDFWSNKLLDLVDMPKQYLHLEQYKRRFNDRQFIRHVCSAVQEFVFTCKTIIIATWMQLMGDSPKFYYY